jgi:hypothetical protein
LEENSLSSSQLAGQLAFFIATRRSKRVTKKGKIVPYVRLEGSDWEEMFANAINADWTPTNAGLDDVRFEQCAWGAKTVKHRRPSTVSQVPLISGRNSLAFSYGIRDPKSHPIAFIASKVLEIYNERVYAIRNKWKHLRSVVLIKSDDLSEVAVFEFDTIAYQYERYNWVWNEKGNLEGYDKEDNKKFTWQPSGSQFTIQEKVPDNRLCLQVKAPPNIDRQKFLDELHYDKSWITIKTEKPMGEVAESAKECEPEEE